MVDRVKDILINARDSLGDPSKDRWSDAVLIRKLNNGLKDIAIRSGIFKKTANIKLVKGKYLYEMPDDFLSLKGALYDLKPMDAIPAHQMIKKYSSDWRKTTTTDSLSAVVLDRQDVKTVRVFPIPFIDSLVDTYTYSPDVYGVTDALTGYTFDTDVGLVGDIFDNEIVDIDVPLYGLLSDSEEGTYFTIEYVRNAKKVSQLSEDPELPEIFDHTLIRYVVGHAFRDDINTKNRVLGNEELQLYALDRDEVINTGKFSSTSMPSNTLVEYRGME